MQWFDAHNHLQDCRLGSDIPTITQLQRNAGINGCVVNATCEADWLKVAKLADDFPDLIRPAFGIHPWKSHTATPGWQGRLTNLLEKYPTAGIGECGVDSWINDPPHSIQNPIFLVHLKLARELNRPLTIHCLKAWGPLFDCFNMEPPPPRFLMHSFGGSIELAHRLTPLGAYFSLSGYALHPRKQKTLQTFRQIPVERILIETDAPDMRPPADVILHPLSGGLNHPANLSNIGTHLAAHLQFPPSDFAEMTYANAKTWLGV